ncbi:hypothetical protein [Knoellia aerolata]|uniref:Adenylyl cyclase n=1 Tax=Knoellia aerolata DSM 18566 TaxID=1385519 RepID=A0A0A0JZ84_9MICO|nr:hypothetical protein [Knoellia aerolata]KGN42473.1 hypothetical protein N801_15420 [Knoellia aerolata DSM 18566]
MLEPLVRTPRPRRTLGRLALVATLAAALTVTGAATSTAAPPDDHPFGTNVLVFDPSMPTAQIQAHVDAIHAQQVDAEMGDARWSLLFKPGTYGTAAQPLQVKVGYYTEVAGLGASPGDVTINGKVEVYNRCLDAGGTQNCIALNNFWRSLSNLTIAVSSVGQDGCRSSANFWAVSQASSMRRVHVTGANLSLMDYCTAGPQFASGGFIADSALPFVINGSQQQWITRNSAVAGWSNGVWNQVFSGVDGAPSEDGFPTPPYTTLATTPLSREKPYLHVDGSGAWQVRVPSAGAETRGTTWSDGLTPGRTIPLTDFHVATPADSARTLNTQLARGKHLLLTPGLYDIDRTLDVRRAGTVVLGMGQATLTSVGGATPLRVADRAGTVIAGVTIDAGKVESESLMTVGPSRGTPPDGAGKRSSAADPLTLSDVYFRVGGPHVGRTEVALEILSDHVLVDHTWVWRADHGIEGFTEGVNGDTDRWRTNTARNGLVVDGDDVTATGLFVEHFQEHNTIWNGERGVVVLYQNELPYDPPTQADWQRPDGTLGWTGFLVSPDVRTHRLFGGGSYVFNQNNPAIVTERGFEAPRTPGVTLHHLLTVNLGAGTIRHVVNDVGDQVDNTRTGVPAYVVDHP